MRFDPGIHHRRSVRTPGGPVWQRNYYEHIIRSAGDLMLIRKYISDNPAKWADDPDNPANIQKVS